MDHHAGHIVEPVERARGRRYGRMLGYPSMAGYMNDEQYCVRPSWEVSEVHKRCGQPK